MIEIIYKKPSPPRANQPWLPSVHGVILKNNTILLHQREDHKFLALPGGKIELGESITECLKREIFEETGLEINPKKLLGVISSPEYLLGLKNLIFQPFLIIFLCSIRQGNLKLNSESASFTWMSERNVAGLDTFPLVKEIGRHVWSRNKETFFDESQLPQIKGK